MATPNQPPNMGGMPPLQPGQQPTPEQIQMIQRQLAVEAQKHGMSVQEYVGRLRAQAIAQQQQMRMQQMQQQQAQGGGPLPPPGQAPGGGPLPPPGQMPPQGQAPPQQQQMQRPPQPQPPQPQQIPINSGAPPKPEALAVANFLKSQDLKPRTCLFNNQRKELFRVKRAIRALHTPAYKKARTKNPLLPEVHDRVTAENTFKLLPMSLLALRVSKVDPHEGHDHAKKKVKGLWTVKVEPQQEAHDDMYYCWLYEGPQWKTKLYAAGALAVILAVVFFPVWPYKMRLGVWYLSMACLGLLGCFFAMAIFRLILFLITMFAAPPGLWLYPNLFEDVGFFDSFKPVWAWQQTAEGIKEAKLAKKAKKAARKQRAEAEDDEEGGEEHNGPRVEEIEDDEEGGDGEEGEEEAETTGAEVAQSSVHQRVPQSASVEEGEDE